LNSIDLFSGVGGFALGFHRAGISTELFCEIEPYARKVLAKNFPGVPIYSDIRKSDFHDFKRKVDIVCGGFPCPAFSRAGKRGGFEQDDLFYEIVRVVEEVEPKVVVLENVEGVTKWAEEIRNEIQARGYRYESAILDGRDFGIPQARRRYFGIGVRKGIMSGSQYLRRLWGIKSENFQPTLPYSPDAKGRWTPTISSKDEWRTIFAGHTRSGVTDGVPNRMDRMRCLGNSINPQIAEWLGHFIKEIIND
jgi:DNA (cytosine-5)-methyltransferase 1